MLQRTLSLFALSFNSVSCCLSAAVEMMAEEEAAAAKAATKEASQIWEVAFRYTVQFAEDHPNIVMLKPSERTKRAGPIPTHKR